MAEGGKGDTRGQCVRHFDHLYFCYCALQLVHHTETPLQAKNTYLFRFYVKTYFKSTLPALCDARAAPMHQMHQYYRAGELDDCRSQWSAFLACIRLNDSHSSPSHQLQPHFTSRQHGLWTHRSADEAHSFWHSSHNQPQ